MHLKHLKGTAAREGHLNVTGFAGAVQPHSLVTLESSKMLERKQAPASKAFKRAAQSLFSAINTVSAGGGEAGEGYIMFGMLKHKPAAFWESLLYEADLTWLSQHHPRHSLRRSCKARFALRGTGEQSLSWQQAEMEAGSVLCERAGKWPPFPLSLPGSSSPGRAGKQQLH